MHRSELETSGQCSSCGCEVRGNIERGFAFGSRGLLCQECAIERGGSYDERLGTWVDEPRIDDLGRFFD